MSEATKPQRTSDAEQRRVVVTGIGMVHPCGIGHEQAWAAVRRGTSAIRPIDRFDASGAVSPLAAALPPEFSVSDFLPARYAKRTDAFTQYALVATDLAIQDAKLDPSTEDPFRIGTSFGNSGGGWGLYERGLHEYFRDAPTMVNPYLATSWFNYAAQGYACIRHGIRGDSATYSAGRASGALATYFGARSVQWGINDVVLAGGCEAPLTPLGLASHGSSGELSPSTVPEAAYRPFDQQREGMVLGEGSTFLVLEEETRAHARGAHIYGEVLSVRHCRGEPTQPDALRRAMVQALVAGGIEASDVDLVFPEAAATVVGDRVEATALRDVFGGAPAAAPVTAPRSGYGHQHGASFATEVALGLLSGRDESIPPTLGCPEPDESLGLDVVRQARRAEIDTVLVNSAGRDGMCTSAVLATERP